MTVPVFEEYEPAPDCPCAGCGRRRRELARGLPVSAGGHRAAHGARRALVAVTAAGVALGAAGAAGVAAAVEADVARADGVAGAARADVARAVGDAGPDSPPGDQGPTSPQGDSAPLYGRPLPGPRPDSGPHEAETNKITRAEIISRAKVWVNAEVPYSMEKYWSDGYRQDCSGYVSMAWNLGSNEWTGSLATFGERIEREELQPGDMLLFHNPENPTKGSHVTLFGGWADYTHSYYLAYEQTKPHARAQATPMAYWSNSDSYVPYRYKGVVADPDGKNPGEGVPTVFPGEEFFGPGADNAYVTQLGEMLVKRGGKRFYEVGPGPRWSESDRRATEAFQRAQGWRGSDADGLPGPTTWLYLVNGLGKDIPAAEPAERGNGQGAHPAPGFPGAGHFRPGRANTYVEQLGEQLVRKGFGRHYAVGPGRRWTEADRRNVRDFQRAQGWRGSDADGYPGPHTWRRLFA